MVTYDNERAICDLNGYIIWELSGNLNNDLSTPLLDAANAKILDPDLDYVGLNLSDSVAGAVTGEAKPDGAANAGAPDVEYYPDFSASKCLYDSLGGLKLYLQPLNIFNNVQVGLPIAISIVLDLLCKRVLLMFISLALFLCLVSGLL